MAVMLLVLIAPVGLWLLISPRTMWWTTTSWRYRNPEANEPSDAGYALMRVSGVLVIVVGIVFTVIGLSTAREAQESQELSKTGSRGELPIVGYRGSGSAVDVYYLLPIGVEDPNDRYSSYSYASCVVSASARSSADGDPTVAVTLNWNPKSSYPDKSKSALCQPAPPGGSRVACLYVGLHGPDRAVVRTDAAIVTPGGEVVQKASSRNEVPLLPEPPAEARCHPRV